jgi:small subunit ribosomal protein S36
VIRRRGTVPPRFEYSSSAGQLGLAACLPETELSTIRQTDAPDAAPDAAVEPEAEGKPTVRVRTAQRLRSVPATVWWLTALHLVVLLAYTILLPTYRSPDEPLHVDLSHVFSEELRYPAWDEADTSLGIQRSLPLTRFHDQSRHLTAEEAIPKHERPSLEELDARPPASAPRGINQLSQHPPLHYVVTGGAMWGLEAVLGDPIGSFDLETWLYRLASVLIIAPLPLIIWRTTGVLSLPRPVRYAAMLVPLAIPQFVHIVSTANNDSLSILLFCAVTPVVVRVADGQVHPRTAALAGVLTGLGLLTKGFAIVMFAWVAVAFLVALRRGGRPALRPVVSGAAVFGATSLVIGGWWWVRNIVLYGKASPSRFDQLVPTVEGVQVDLGRYVHTWGYRTTRRFWGEFGWFETGLPSTLIAVATVATVTVIAVAVIRRDRVADVPVGSRLLLLAPLILLIANQFQRGLAGYGRTGQFPGLQGRYWFGAMAAMSVLIVLGLANLMRSRIQWLPPVVLVGVVIMQGYALATFLRFYWGAPGSNLRESLRALVAWAPLPGELIGMGAVVALVVTAGATWQIVRTAIRPESAPAPQPS